MEITVFIEDDASITFLDTPLTRGFNLGPSVTRRYSNVEPDNAVLRLVFQVVRWLVNDASALANWTRHWHCLWRIHIKNGPILPMRYYNRQTAIDVEHTYFNTHGVNR